MKRNVFFSFLCAAFMLCATGVSAQRFYPIEKVSQKSETRFCVVSGAQEFGINPLIFNEIKSNPQNYYLVIFIGEKANTITVAPKAACTYVVAEVQEVKPADGGKWQIVMSSGLNYTSSNQDWGSVQVGQHVAYATVDGLTKVIKRRPHTVGSDVEITSEVPVSPAPAKPVVILGEENNIVSVNL